MSTTLSIRIDEATKKRLDALAKSSKRSKSFRAAEAIAEYVESEEWQIAQIQAGIADADAGRTVSHGKVKAWLLSRGWYTAAFEVNKNGNSTGHPFPQILPTTSSQ